MKFPSYELLNKYAILHFRNVIHVDYSIILTSSGWPFARDQQVMSSKIKGQDHHCTAWRRIVVVETTLFALSHFDGISRIFFSATIFTSQWTHYKPFGHCWRNNLLKCTSNGCTLLSQIECGAKAKRNGRETIRDFNTNWCCHILGKLLGGRLTICLTHCDNIPFPVQQFNVVDINSWLLYLSIWGIWVTKEKESIDGSITTYTQFSKQPTV